MTGFLVQHAPKPLLKYIRDNHKCTGCGKCCNCAPIALNGKDIKVMAHHLGMSVKDFKKKYTEMYPGNGNLSHFKQEKPCAFLDENNRCKIYGARPDICRSYPKRLDDNIPGECQHVVELIQETLNEKGDLTQMSLMRAQQRRMIKAAIAKEEEK
jgi:Fe-S-cluster containining protein